MSAAYYRPRTDLVAIHRHTGRAALARMERLLARWREGGVIDAATRFERVELGGGTPAAVLSVPAHPVRLVAPGCWLGLGADGVVRVCSPGRPPHPGRVQAVQHLGRGCLDEMDALLARWRARQAVDEHAALNRTSYRGQPAAVLMDSRRRGQLVVPTAWLVRNLDRRLRVVSAARFDAEFAPLDPAAVASDSSSHPPE